MNCSHSNMQCIKLRFLWKWNFLDEDLSKLTNLIRNFEFWDSCNCS